ncbi:MAG TPA: conjugative transposon protein TraJ, partial [Flavisolibacter sp.]|nr:conjugative transposon protein TraJ [Flavisolibacter sp.]
MKKYPNMAVLLTATALLLPGAAYCQSLADEMSSLHSLLDQLYDEMIPLCSNLIGVSQGIAGFAALWYIASRVWRHLANAEPIDFYPLFRPFVIGFCIMLFPLVLAMINGIMKPTVTATGAMVESSNKAIEELLRQKEEAIKTTD